MSSVNAPETNVGGWEKSKLRAKMNSGEIWNLMPADFQSKVKTARKLTNNVGGGSESKTAAVTATSDKLFLLSHSEILGGGWGGYPWSFNEGTQYEAFEGRVTNMYSANPCLSNGYTWWERSVTTMNIWDFLHVEPNGNPSTYDRGVGSYGYICPAWCF